MIAPFSSADLPLPDSLLETDLELAPLLPAAADRPRHLAREHRRVEAVLAAGGWGLRSGGAMSLVRPLPWDSDHFGFPCADLVRLYCPAGARPPGTEGATALSRLLDRTLDECRARGIVLLSARPRAELTAAIQQLLARGSLLVDTSVELGAPLPLPSRPGPSPRGSGVTVRDPAPGDLQPLEEIAAGFVHNRFHRDPRIRRDAAAGVYRSWVIAAREARHGELVVAERDGQVAGLATFARSGDALGAGTMGLVAVHPAHRGCGVVDSLITEVARRAGTRALVTSTQVSNTPALRAFGRHGLLALGARHILHTWLD